VENGSFDSIRHLNHLGIHAGEHLVLQLFHLRVDLPACFKVNQLNESVLLYVALSVGVLDHGYFPLLDNRIWLLRCNFDYLRRL